MEQLSGIENATFWGTFRGENNEQASSEWLCLLYPVSFSYANRYLISDDNLYLFCCRQQQLRYHFWPLSLCSQCLLSPASYSIEYAALSAIYRLSSELLSLDNGTPPLDNATGKVRHFKNWGFSKSFSKVGFWANDEGENWANVHKNPQQNPKCISLNQWS